MGAIPPRLDPGKIIGTLALISCRTCGLRFHLAHDVPLPKHNALGNIQCPGSGGTDGIRCNVPARARKGVR